MRSLHVFTKQEEKRNVKIIHFREKTIHLNTEEFAMIPLSLKTIEPTAIAAAYSAATSLPGLLAVILKAGLSIVISSGLPQKE